MDYYDILLAKKLNGGGGGEATLINKNISSNGTYNASSDNADGYKKVVVSVPNPSTGSLSITSNNTYDVTNYASAVVNVSGGIDLSAIKQSTSLQNIGGLFNSFENGNWDSLEYTCVSGTNPIEINFGREIKGFICYPKNIKVVDDLNGEQVGFDICLLTDADETGTQERLWSFYRIKSSGNVNSTFPRATASIVNGVMSLVPSYPTNAQYHPFRFGDPFIFVYWW